MIDFDSLINILTCFAAAFTFVAVGLALIE